VTHQPSETGYAIGNTITDTSCLVQ